MTTRTSDHRHNRIAFCSDVLLRGESGVLVGDPAHLQHTWAGPPGKQGNGPAGDRNVIVRQRLSTFKTWPSVKINEQNCIYMS